MKNNSGFSFFKFLLVVIVIGLIVKAVVSTPQGKSMLLKWQVKRITPIMQQWIEAQENWYKTHGNYCKSVGEKGICVSFPDGADLGVHWPSHWVHNDILHRKEVPCGNSTSCKNHNWGCVATTKSVFCTVDGKIVLQIGDALSHSFRDHVYCSAVHDKVSWSTKHEEEDALCKEISGKEPVKHPLTGTNYYPL